MTGTFDVEAYWASRLYKKWVVLLTLGKAKRRTTRDQMIIMARTEERAIATARRHSMMPPRAEAYARLARPEDLGAR